MHRLVVAATVTTLLLASAASGQTPHGTATVPAAGTGIASAPGTTSSGEPPIQSPRARKAAIASTLKKNRQDRLDELKLEHDLHICIGC